MAGFRISDPVTIRSARAAEAGSLTALAVRSKAYWGYDPEFMATCRDELTVTARRMAAETILVADIAGRPAGFAALDFEDHNWPEISLLFVAPERIGHGIGRALTDALKDRVRALGAGGLLVDADPFAEPFYRRQGFRRIGESPSASIPDRRLPRLRWCA